MRIGRFLKTNWPYVFMLCFVVFISLLLFMAQKQGKPIKDELGQPYRIELIDAAKFKESQKAIEAVYHRNPPLYLFLMAVNFFMVLVFFGSILLDGLLIYKWKKGKTFIKRTLEGSYIRWDFLDVIKFTIMFYAFAYVFMLSEAALLQKFPLLDNKNFRFIFNATVIDIVGIIFVLNFVKFIYRQRLSAIGITLKNFFKNVFYGIAGYLAIIPILFITMMITAVIITIFKYRPPVQPIVDILLKEQKIPLLIYSSLFAAIAGPIMEEIFFRGFMYNAIKKHIGVFWGIIITSSVFSFLHAHVVGFMPIMILGILLAYLYEKTGSLVPSITVHITHNLASLFMVFLVKALNFQNG